MSEVIGRPESDLPLREQIDELATRLVIDGASSDLVEDLVLLSRSAGGAGCPETARIAAGLAEKTRECLEGKQGTAVDELLRDGVAQLQQALEHEARASRPPAAEPAGVKAAPPQLNSLAQDPELLGDFILESREHLRSIEQLVLTLEREPANPEAIHSVFRGFHTIKGLAGFLEFGPIQEVSHEVETALNLAREGQLAVTSAVIDVILESVDYLRRSMAVIESGGTCQRNAGHDPLLEKVRALMTGQSGAVEQAPATLGAASPPPETAAEPVAQAAGDARRTAAAVESLSVRVDTLKLDYLVDMVGEMVIAQSLVRHSRTLAAASDQRLQRDLAQLTRITGEVQKTAMAMRMVPIGQLFQRTARQVRDLSRKVGKNVELVTRGEDTEVDKTISEELADPLMHMVRNAIDHGIEGPGERQAAGKAPQARVTLAAYHQAGQIVVEVADDGRGLDCAKILAKAVQKGLVVEAAHLSESDTFRLILEPGFSTAEQVSDISGRGVGMDVVRKQLDKLRGRIEIRSVAGRGTTFLLKLPLTLAIIDGLVVTVSGQRYIVPLFAVREMFRPSAESLFTVQSRQEMAMVRGRLLPVLRLYKRFGLAPRTEDPCQALLIVAETEGEPFCLMVDELIGKQEVVIKSLGKGLGKVPGIAGGAILGDGRVGLILDMGGLWGGHANA